MSSSRGYFQFPLCVLAFANDYKQRLQTIVSYCLCEYARRTNPKFPSSARKSSLDEAADFLGVRIGSYDDTIKRWKDGQSFVCQWEQRHSKDARVRIGTTLLWEALSNTGASYREFSILCAINSIIGNRSIPIRITEPSIRVRAAGFKSQKVLRYELHSDELREAMLLTVDQVRYTLENLHKRKFFARARVGAKTVKYMLGVNDEQLLALLRQRETYGLTFKADRAKKDADLMTAIRSAKRRPIEFGKDQTDGISLPTQSRHDSDMIPDINICSFNNGSSIKSTENIRKKIEHHFLSKVAWLLR